MTELIVAVICLGLATVAGMLRRAYFSLPTNELKRRASQRQEYYRRIFPAAVYGQSLRSMLWLVQALASAGGLVLIARISPIWLGLVVTTLWLWIVFSWLPNAAVIRPMRFLAVKATPFFVWLYGWAHPVIKLLNRGLRFYSEGHTGIYESEDLKPMMDRQLRQTDNRISPKQLSQIQALLNFEDAKAADCFEAWNHTLQLAASDSISPKLLDEMHRSGQNEFWVVASRGSKQVLGIVHKDDVGLKSEGKVSDYMHECPESLTEEVSLESALKAFASSGRSQLLVTDPAGKPLGTLMLKDALAKLINYEEEASEETESNISVDEETSAGSEGGLETGEA